jgi:hypothetical protein
VIARILADAVLVLHFAFVAFVVLGGFLVLRWPKLAWVHAPAVIWGIAITSVGGVCPLTPLEKHFIVRGGGEAYRGGFIAHYLTSVIYPEGMTRHTQVVLALLLAAFTAFVYWRVWQHYKSRLP